MRASAATNVWLYVIEHDSYHQSRCMAHEAGTTIHTFARILIDFAEEHELGDIRAANPAVICEPFAALQAASTRLATAPWRAKFKDSVASSLALMLTQLKSALRTGWCNCNPASDLTNTNQLRCIHQCSSTIPPS